VELWVIALDEHTRLLALIQRLYAAPGSNEGWQDFLLDLHTSLDGTGASFISHNYASQDGNVSVSNALDEEGVRLYQHHWGSLDPWARSPTTRTLPSGTVVVGDELVSHADMRRSAFYNDFARHYDVVRCIVGMIEVERHTVSVLSVSRSEKRGSFGQEDVALLNGLMPHLQRALQMHRRLTDLQVVSDASAAALDRLTHGVLLVDASGRIMLANRAAGEILRAHDGLSVHHRELFGARVQDTNALRRLIADAVGISTGDGLGAGGMVMIGRPSGRAALRVLVTPVARRQVLLGREGAAACIFVTDPERFHVPSSAHVRHVFGLTAAETRVAMAMLDGKTVEMLADELCISRNTARTHLQRLFAKTGTTRQADLIRILLGAHAPLRFD
jgi:DNA-binding CsgD family transcriptional regulator/GAF domain-containing protein